MIPYADIFIPVFLIWTGIVVFVGILYGRWRERRAIKLFWALDPAYQRGKGVDTRGVRRSSYRADWERDLPNEEVKRLYHERYNIKPPRRTA